MQKNSILDCIGNTPVVKLHKFDTGVCELFIKLETLNPTGSIKDRMAISMVNAFEQEGKLKSGDTIVEASSGNTGISLALVALLKGYKCTIVVFDKVSDDKIKHLEALGAEVVVTRTDVTKEDPEYYQNVAAKIAKEKNAVHINQFENPANAQAHELTTGPEILEQMEGDIDAVVVGVGSAGTLGGLTNYFKKHSPKTEIVLADPEGSVLVDYIKTGKTNEVGEWLVEGIGEDYIPTLADFSLVKHAYYVSDQDSFRLARELLNKEGIFVGSSTGTLLQAALNYCQEQSSQKRVLTFACDRGMKYLSKIFNDQWMKKHSLL